jgi:hypothetical protein
LHKRAFERAQTQCHAAAQFVEERIGGGGEKKCRWSLRSELIADERFEGIQVERKTRREV